MNQEEKHIELINLTIKKLAKEASNAELDQLELLLEQDELHRKNHEEIVKTWEESGKSKGITNQETEEEWKRLQVALNSEVEKKPTFSIYKIAATISLVIVASIVAYLFIVNAETTIVANTVQEEILDDGSVVTLNSEASLTYKGDFNKQNREVTLRGEAYFEVESDQSKPFVIHAQGVDITVVGTSFNVKALENQETAEVVVNSGKVNVSYGTKSVSLVAGEKALLMKKSGKLFKMPNDNPNFQSWKTKKFEFADTPLIEVINLLNEVYKKSLYVQRTQLHQCPITVSFENQSFESILKVLENTLDLTIRETTDGLLITGDNC